jgi:hypothetical protein
LEIIFHIDKEVIMGIKVIHVDRENFKTIYKLQVYEIVGLSTPKYRLDEDGRPKDYRNKPGFCIFGTDAGYFETLAEAEKHIKRIAAQGDWDLYGFVVSERPLGHIISGMRDISTRRYLKDGTLWQVSSTSGVCRCDGKNMELGDTGFYGRDPETIRFKEGDIVEIANDEFVELAIVWQTPATKEQMKPIWNALRGPTGEKFPDNYPDILDDRYVVAILNPLDADVFCIRTHMPPTVDVLPPSQPVSKTLAAKLRKALRQTKKEECPENYVPNVEDFI